MSFQRSSLSTKQTTPPNVLYGSDTALHRPSNEDKIDYLNVTKRQKRTFNELSEVPGQYMSEIKSMISDLKVQKEQKFESLTSAINLLVNQNQDIQKSVDYMSSQYDELLNKINTLEKDNCDYKKRVKSLENRLESLERNARSSAIEISNVPKQSNENKQSMINIIRSVGAIISPETPILDEEVKDIYRSKSEAIIIDFSSTCRKESIVSAYKQFNKYKRTNKEPQLNTQHINIPGTSRPVFVAEVLTTKAGRLHCIARQLVKNKKIAATWTAFGKVYMKKEEGQLPTRIEDEAELGF